MADAWFVVNAAEADARWVERAGFGKRCLLEPEDGRFEQVGIHLSVIEPGDRSTLYHAEEAQEDFLVLRGSCTAIVEEQERNLKQWDFVHCPPMTAHTFVATGTGSWVILATGNRRDDLERVCPRSEVALRYGAGSEVTTADPERRGRWEVKRPEHWDELPWAEQP